MKWSSFSSIFLDMWLFRYCRFLLKFKFLFRFKLCFYFKEIDEMIDTVDKNGDGKISFSEFRYLLLNLTLFEVGGDQHPLPKISSKTFKMASNYPQISWLFVLLYDLSEKHKRFFGFSQWFWVFRWGARTPPHTT